MLEQDQKSVSHASLWAFLLILAATLVLATRMIAPYVITLIMGAILAVLVAPAYHALKQRVRGHSQLAAVVVTLALILLVLGPILLLSGLALRQATELGHWLSSSQDISFAGLTSKLSDVPELDKLLGDPEQLQAQLQDWGKNLGGKATGLLLGAAKAVPDLILQLFIACLACYFFLVDRSSLSRWLNNKLPIEPGLRQTLAATFKDTAVAVIWASTAAALAQGALMLGAFLALGVPAAVLAAGATFVFAWLPLLGSTPVWVAGAVYLYLQGSLVKVALTVAAGIVTGVTDNFVRPLVLKGRGEMHPLVSLVAIFGGLQMFGLVGVFLGPIVAAMVITLLKVWPSVAERAGIVFGTDADRPPGDPYQER